MDEAVPKCMFCGCREKSKRVRLGGTIRWDKFVSNPTSIDLSEILSAAQRLNESGICALLESELPSVKFHKECKHNFCKRHSSLFVDVIADVSAGASTSSLSQQCTDEVQAEPSSSRNPEHGTRLSSASLEDMEVCVSPSDEVFETDSLTPHVSRAACRDVFQYFCETVIEGQLLRDGYATTIAELESSFVACLEEHDNSAIEPYSRRHLKRLLQAKYPDLLFLNISPLPDFVAFKSSSTLASIIRNAIRQEDVSLMDIVFGESMPSTDDTLDRDFKLAKVYQAPSPKTCSSEDPLEKTVKRARFSTSSPKEDASPLDTEEYHAARTIHHSIKATPDLFVDLNVPWPPTSEYLTMDVMRKQCGDKLLCFVSLLLDGKEHSRTFDMDAIEPYTRMRACVIAQLLIYAAFRGRRNTPISLLLSNFVRHFSRNERLQRLLNNLGLCNSVGVSLSLETDLARLTLLSNCGLPRDITQATFTMLVFDNIDFQERSLVNPGKTTHATNGIIIQFDQVEGERLETAVSIKRSGTRSLSVEPLQLPPARLLPQESPPILTPPVVNAACGDAYVLARKKDFVWIMSHANTTASVPQNWTAFNEAFYCDGQVPATANIGYLEIIDASPTQPETIEEIIRRCDRMKAELALNELAVCFDLAIYRLFQRVRWSDQVLLKSYYVCLGQFHLTMSYIGCIGARFGELGLQDLIVEAGIAPPLTTLSALSGHHYGTGVRFLEIVWTAMQILFFESFQASLSPEKREDVQKFIEEITAASSVPDLKSIVEGNCCTRIMELMEEFARSRSEQNATFRFWYSFILMCDDLFSLLRATKEGNWFLFLSTLRSILPWFFAYNHPNYARYGCVYWIESSNLETEHPSIFEEFVNGNFVVQRSKNAFARIAPDMTLEQTMNLDSKSPGGLTGITFNKGGMQRWQASRNHTAKLVTAVEDIANCASRDQARNSTKMGRQVHDSDAVNSIMSVVQLLRNPFLVNGAETRVSNIMTGSTLDEGESALVLAAKDSGEESVLDFISQRLLSHNVNFKDPIRKTSLKTPKPSSRVKKLPNSKDILARLLIIGEDRQVSLEEVLSYNLTAVPEAIGYSVTGTMFKGDKAALLNYLFAKFSISTNAIPPPNCAWIFDGMFVVRKLGLIGKTFGDAASNIIRHIIGQARHFDACRIDVVMDTYKPMSTKHSERQRRGKLTCQVVPCQDVPFITASQLLPKQVTTFFESDQNKRAFIVFLSTAWTLMDTTSLENLEIFYSFEGKCTRYFRKGTSVEAEEVPRLFSNHEEADTKLLLHANDVGSNSSGIVLVSSDTDVGVLAVANERFLHSPLIVQGGTKRRPKSYNVNDLAKKLTSSQRDALLGLHAFSGCDTVSFFKRHSKMSLFDLMLTQEAYTALFAGFGTTSNTCAEETKNLERFLCNTYGFELESSLDKVRFLMFTAQRSDNFPPTSDSFGLHVKRARLQAYVWRSCLECEIQELDPADFGWKVETSCLVPLWDTKGQAPAYLVNPVICRCSKTNCTRQSCMCKKAGLSCSLMCGCDKTKCDNKREEAVHTELDDFDLGCEIEIC